MGNDTFGLVGTRLAGCFQVEEQVAEGGFAVVYRATHTGFRAPVALKCLKLPEAVGTEKRGDFLEQFRAEGELLFKLSARLPHVVRPLHVDAEEAPNGRFMPFMALEWLEGETLRQWADRRAAESLGVGSFDELVRLLTPVAETLACAHHFQSDQGVISIVHRDIKPENLFLARQGGQTLLKILDFGIGKAKAAASETAGLKTIAGATGAFTPTFGAPEQWMPSRFGRTGPWTDVFGLALTLTELYVGRPILDGDQQAILAAVLDESRRPTPGNHGCPLPAAVEGVMRQAMAVHPQQRFADAGSFWQALNSALLTSALESSGSGDGHSPAASPPLQATRAYPVIPTLRSADEGAPRAEPLPIAEPTRLGAATFAEPSSFGTIELEAPSTARPTLDPGAQPSIPLELATLVGDSANRSVKLHEQVPKTTQLAPVELKPQSGLATHLLIPLTSIGCGALLSALGQRYASAVGEVFRLGPIPLSWVTVPMVLLGALGGLYGWHRARISR